MDIIHFDNIHDAKTGLALYSPAFLLLDLDTKGITTFLAEVADNWLRPRPFILVSADFSKSAERTAILRLGADACVGKPVDADEVLAVITAVQRRERWVVRQSGNRRLPRIEYKDLMIDPFQRNVTMHGKPVTLTTKEFDILCLLAQYSGNVLAKDEIYKTVWDTELDLSTSIIPNHISSIRKKLGLSGKNNDYIQTVFGVGYRFERSSDGHSQQLSLSNTVGTCGGI